MSTETVNTASNASEGKKIRMKNLAHALELIDNAMSFWTWNTKIAVFPELFLTGFPIKEDVKQWMNKACFYMPDEETDKLAEKAVEHGIYIVGHGYELDKDWTNRYFNTIFIINPNGKIILKYRKNYTLCGTPPHDILNEYIKKYGEKSLFPVVNTSIGKLGCLGSIDSIFPENARCLAMNGAEVILMPASTAYGLGGHKGMEGWTLLCKARAYENSVYYAVANHGPYVGTVKPYYPCGKSMIIDYKGEEVVVADGDGECVIKGMVDINTSRRERTHGFLSPLSRLRTELYVPYYKKSFWPPNLQQKRPFEKNIYEEGKKIRGKIISALIKKGIFVDVE